MERVIQSDQTPETLGTKGEKGHMEQEAPWRPPSRAKCVDELMHSGLLGLEEMEGKMGVQKERGVRVGAELCVWVCVRRFEDAFLGVHVSRHNHYTSLHNITQIY